MCERSKEQEGDVCMYERGVGGVYVCEIERASVRENERRRDNAMASSPFCGSIYTDAYYYNDAQ